MKTQIEIFKAGKHTAMSGDTLTFSESDLKASVAAYDPAIFEAPIVVGHPKLDAPAYGWAKSLHFSEDGKLIAEPHQVDAEFSEIVEAGRYKKVSAAFFAPDAPNNPVPGVWYLKHIGFLGAQAPAVKGLKSVSFSDDGKGIYEFADWDKMTIAGLFRNVREWIIGTSGVETADKVLPSYQIESLQINAAQDDDDELSHFSEPENKSIGDDMTPEQKAKMDALEAENQALKDKQAAFAEAEKQQKMAATHSEHMVFAEGLMKAGKLLPAQKDVVVATLDALAKESDIAEFGEGDQKEPLLQAYKKSLELAPKVVEFGEHEQGNSSGIVQFSAPSGFAVDAESLDRHNKVLAYAQQHNVTYEIALSKCS